MHSAGVSPLQPARRQLLSQANERSADDTAATEARRPVDAGRELGGGKPDRGVYTQPKGLSPPYIPRHHCSAQETTPRQSLTDYPRNTEAGGERMLLLWLRRANRLLYPTVDRKGPDEKSSQERQ